MPNLTGGGRQTLHLPWIAALVVLVVCAVVGLASAFSALHTNWTDSFTYSHGYLVLAMVLWLLWRDRAHLSETFGRPATAGIAALALLTAAYIVADILDIAIGRLILLPPVVIATAAGIGGLPFAQRIAPAAAFLYFAIPIWDAAIRPLQELTTAAVSGVLAYTPVTAFIEGNYVTTPHGAFEIAEGCSGVHFFIVGAAMATFYAMMWCRRWSSRILLVATAVLVAMVANWIRVLTLILVGEHTSMQHYLIQEDHYVFGWVLFGVVMIPVFWFARQLELADTRQATKIVGVRNVAVQPTSSAKVLIAGALCASLLLLPSSVKPTAEAPPEQPEELPFGAVVTSPSLDWHPTTIDDTWAPAYKRPWALFRGAFRGRYPAQVDVYAARYDQQQPQSKLIYFSNRLDAGWHRVRSSVQSVPFAEGARVVQETELSAGGTTRLIWEWYLVGSYATHERSLAKMLAVPALLVGQRESALISLSAVCRPDCLSAREAMRSLLVSRGAAMEKAARGAGH